MGDGAGRIDVVFVAFHAEMVNEEGVIQPAGIADGEMLLGARKRDDKKAATR